MVLTSDLTYSLPEEKEIGFLIGNVANDSNLDNELTDNERNNMKYTILDSKYASYFSVSESTSSLSVRKRLDRESLEECEFSAVCELSIDIVAQSSVGTFFKKVKVKVIVTDINDHPPQFQESDKTLQLSEAFVVGSSSPIPGAVDMDSGDNGVKKYTLRPGDTPFSLRYVQYVDGSSAVSLVVNKTLDRESVDGYQLQVVAEDGGEPKLTGTLHLNVIITDVNDNPPSFNQSSYSVSVKEGLPIGTKIYNVRATDPDLNENGKVTYKLSPHQSDTIKQIFAVNSSTGDIYTLKPIAYSSDNPYKVIIEANDGAAVPLMSQATVFVTVLDSGNDAPVINVNLLSNTEVAKISENASVGAAVAHIAVSDDDTDENGLVTCSIAHDVFKLENIIGEQNEYKVVVAQHLDRETTELYTVIITCIDGGSPPKNSSAQFDVQVLDENDHRPTFVKHRYDVTMDETRSPGAFVVKVSALDLDKGLNAEIEYFIESSFYDFKVDAFGNINANFVFDRETVSQMEFRVIAQDKGSSPLTGTTVVSINLTDINDNSPRFNKSVYIMHATENQEPGHYIGEVIASDLDLGKNAAIKFIADPVIDDIEVLPDGSIFTTARLDRESRPHGYSFNVVAYDEGTPPLNSTAHVTVFVVDENDNAPLILFPSPDNRTVQIVYEKPTNTVITSIIAVDNDTDNNAILRYSIVQIDMLNIFRINPVNGEITLARPLSSADMRSYFFTVEVKDTGIPEHRDRQNMTIIISSNKPIVLPHSEPEKDNTLIVVIIVCITIILSGAIIMGIFLIRRMDKKKKNKKRQSQESKNDEKDLYDSIHKNGSIPKVEPERNGKKVSFSNQELGLIEKNHMHLTNGIGAEEKISHIADRQKNPPSSFGRSLQSSNGTINQSNSSLQNIQMTRLQLHQTNLQSLSIPNQQHFHRKHEDNHSETSGETNDSGRGGSESDIHSSGFNQSVDLDYTKSRYSPINSPGRPLLTKKNIELLPHSKDRQRQQHSSSYINTQNPHKRQFNHISYGPPYKANMAWNSISDVLNGSMGTIDDYEDDTTTSGSYVVDEQDLDLEYTPQDCVV